MKRVFYMAIILLILAGCDSGDETVNSVGGTGGGQISNENETTPAPTPNASPLNRFHHYNPDSYEMGSASVSFVACPGQLFDECSLNGAPFNLHGQMDEGRQTWVLYGNKHLSGEVVCRIGDSYYSVSVGSHGMQFGSCR